MMILSRLFTPTSNKRLNELVGFLYFVLACLLFLALVSYSPLDPSLNTAAAVSTRHPAHNWVGVLGALVSDLLLQSGGIAVFLFPLFVALLGWRWFRSLKIDAASAKVIGALVLFLFVSALLGLLPWHWHWLRVIPAEGLSGRILADVMVRYLNRSGAYIVCLALSPSAFIWRPGFPSAGCDCGFKPASLFCMQLPTAIATGVRRGRRPRRRERWRGAEEPRPSSSKRSLFLESPQPRPRSFAWRRTTRAPRRQPLLRRLPPSANRLRVRMP